MYCLFCEVLCIVCVYMCTELLPPGGYTIAVEYIISYHIKGKIRPITSHEGPEVEQRYSSSPSLTSALDGVGGQGHARASLPTR